MPIGNSKVNENLRRSYTGKDIFILSDSQAVLKSLECNEIYSKLCLECIQALNRLGGYNKVTLRWVPGHTGIDGNEAADKVARSGAEGPTIGPEPICGIPKSTHRQLVTSWARSHSRELWMQRPGQKHAKALLSGYSRNYTSELMNLNRNQLRILTRTLTGHCRLNKHLNRMGISDTPACRYCQKEDETPMHILCHCEPLIHKRSPLLLAILIMEATKKTENPVPVVPVDEGYVIQGPSNISIHPSYTKMKLTYRVVCRHRYHFAKVAMRKQFMKELHNFERLQPNALDGVRVHREFSQGILSHKIPPPRYMNKIIPDPLKPKQRMRVENIIAGKTKFT